MTSPEKHHHTDAELVRLLEDEECMEKHILVTPTDLAIDDAWRALMRHFTEHQVRPPEVAMLAATLLQMKLEGKRLVR